MYIIRLLQRFILLASKYKSLNSKRTVQYANLSRLEGENKSDENQKSQQSLNKIRTIPRAKKSTSQSWLDALECKPELTSL
jgi:hypothetical protein